MQAKEKTPEIIWTLINNLEDCIEHIDVYCAYYSRLYISICGRSTLRRLRPMIFIEKTRNAFPHVYAWWYVRKLSHIETPLSLEIDHFDGLVTPAWRELKDREVDFQVFFSGDECNALISLADMVLKLIEIYHHGTVDGRTLLRPVRDLCKSYVGKRKLWFHNLGNTGSKIKASAPDIHLPMNVALYFKHPIYYSVWDPGRPRERVKKSYEWIPVYNAIANKAFENKGAMKC